MYFFVREFFRLCIFCSRIFSSVHFFVHAYFRLFVFRSRIFSSAFFYRYIGIFSFTPIFVVHFFVNAFSSFHFSVDDFSVFLYVHFFRIPTYFSSGHFFFWSRIFSFVHFLVFKCVVHRTTKRWAYPGLYQPFGPPTTHPSLPPATTPPKHPISP